MTSSVSYAIKDLCMDIRAVIVATVCLFVDPGFGVPAVRAGKVE